ncbi:MAG: hypothetical protein U0169_25035 [Polyangiaceae bacterium]
MIPGTTSHAPSPVHVAFAFAGAILAAACGAPETPKSSASLNAEMASDAKSDRPGSLVKEEAPPPAVVEPSAPPTLKRSSLKRAAQAGPPVFLQKVELDDRPVFDAGKFHGLRLVALRGDRSFWSGVDLKPGDVVTKVNGVGVEHPEDMIRIFDTFATAKEVRVDYERNGSAKTLSLPVVDDEPGAPIPAK